jgi:formiminotetrahydrofolate cyclodeaminase
MPTASAQSRPTLAEQTVGELVGALASADVAPGAGAAGAVALALGAACAAKAATITLAHHRDDARLTELRAELLALSERALAGAEQDAEQFAEFMHDKSAETAGRLLRTGERLQHSALALKSILDELAGRVAPALAGDVLAARALCDACLAIQRENLDENQRAARNAGAEPGI